MRIRQLPVFGACVALALSGCTSTPQSLPESGSATPAGTTEEVSDRLKRVEVVRTSSYPAMSSIPQPVQIGAIQVATRLTCAPRHRERIYLAWRGVPTLRKAALVLTRKPSSSAVVVRQSPVRAVVLELSQRGSLISRTPLDRFDPYDRGWWTPSGTTVQCG